MNPKKIKSPNPQEKIIGDNTQNQLQVMYPVNFNPIKTIVNNPKNPIPLDDDDDVFPIT